MNDMEEEKWIYIFLIVLVVMLYGSYMVDSVYNPKTQCEEVVK